MPFPVRHDSRAVDTNDGFVFDVKTNDRISTKTKQSRRYRVERYYDGPDNAVYGRIIVKKNNVLHTEKVLACVFSTDRRLRAPRIAFTRRISSYQRDKLKKIVLRNVSEGGR